MIKLFGRLKRIVSQRRFFLSTDSISLRIKKGFLKNTKCALYHELFFLHLSHIPLFFGADIDYSSKGFIVHYVICTFLLPSYRRGFIVHYVICTFLLPSYRKGFIVHYVICTFLLPSYSERVELSFQETFYIFTAGWC